MLDFLPAFPPFQRKYHIIGAFKEALAPLPAHAAFAMLQPYKLLFHFSTTRWADFTAAPFLFGHGRRIWGRLRLIWKPVLLNANFVLGQLGEKLLVNLVIGDPYASGDYFLIYLIRDRGHRRALGHFSMLPIVFAHGFEHPISNFGFMLLPQVSIGSIGLHLSFVGKAGILLAVYNGERRGGTAATVRYAQKAGREIIMIDPLTPTLANSRNLS